MSRTESVWAAAERELFLEARANGISSDRLIMLRLRPPLNAEKLTNSLGIAEPLPPAAPLMPRPATSHVVSRDAPASPPKQFDQHQPALAVPIGESMARSRSTPALRPIDPLQLSTAASRTQSVPATRPPPHRTHQGDAAAVSGSVQSGDAPEPLAVAPPTPPCAATAATPAAAPPPPALLSVMPPGGWPRPRVVTGLFSTSAPPALWTPSGGNVFSKYRNCAPHTGPRIWTTDPRLPPVIPRTEISLAWAAAPHYPVHKVSCPERFAAPHDTRHHRTKQFDLTPVRGPSPPSASTLHIRRSRLHTAHAHLRRGYILVWCGARTVHPVAGARGEPAHRMAQMWTLTPSVPPGMDRRPSTLL